MISTNFRILACTLLTLAVLAAAPARAEVVAASVNGFEIRHTASIKTTPDKVYAALLQIGRWWNPQHTWSGDAANLTLDARPGGCFCEKLADGGGVQHMSVTMVMPGTLLRLRGALGPLQSEGVSGSMGWSLKPDDAGTVLTLSYKVGGYATRPLTAWAPDVDAMLGEQFGRLKKFIETGKPD